MSFTISKATVDWLALFHSPAHFVVVLLKIAFISGFNYSHLSTSVHEMRLNVCSLMWRWRNRIINIISGTNQHIRNVSKSHLILLIFSIRLRRLVHLKGLYKIGAIVCHSLEPLCCDFEGLGHRISDCYLSHLQYCYMYVDPWFFCMPVLLSNVAYCGFIQCVVMPRKLWLCTVQTFAVVDML